MKHLSCPRPGLFSQPTLIDNRPTSAFCTLIFYVRSLVLLVLIFHSLHMDAQGVTIITIVPQVEVSSTI